MPCATFALLLLPAVVARAPNILFVLADDLDFDYKQDRKAIMPHLRERLADGGLEFVNHVAVVPVCGPSRTSLLAGRYPHNVGYVANARAPGAELRQHVCGNRRDRRQLESNRLARRGTRPANSYHQQHYVSAYFRLLRFVLEN